MRVIWDNNYKVLSLSAGTSSQCMWYISVPLHNSISVSLRHPLPEGSIITSSHQFQSALATPASSLATKGILADTVLLSSSYEGMRHRMRFFSLQELIDAVRGRGAWWAAVHEVAKSQIPWAAKHACTILKLQFQNDWGGPELSLSLSLPLQMAAQNRTKGVCVCVCLHACTHACVLSHTMKYAMNIISHG